MRAGPAGMSAALQATRHGLSVLVLDRQAEPGGQIFRSAGSASADKRKEIGADYARGEALVREFRQSPATFLGGANVWHLAPGRAYVSHQGTSHVMQARQILIATGAMERPVPLPGWTLPGVLGAGAADVLLKSASMLPEGPVVLCGNGPLILQTVVHLKHFGIPIGGVALTGSPATCSRPRCVCPARSCARSTCCTAWAWACAPSSARPATPPPRTFPSAGTAKR